MPLIGAVADDLTGATTTGVLLARSKARTAVFFNEEAAQKARETASLDAILISSNSRPLPKEEAYEKELEKISKSRPYRSLHHGCDRSSCFCGCGIYTGLFTG